jgi:hypothetical protein
LGVAQRKEWIPLEVSRVIIDSIWRFIDPLVGGVLMITDSSQIDSTKECPNVIAAKNNLRESQIAAIPFS